MPRSAIPDARRTIALHFTVPGAPVPFTRVLRGSKQPRAERYRAYKTEVGYRAKLAGAEPLVGPIGVYVQISEPDPACRRYDIDNVLKAVIDGLIGVAFVDDRQIVRAEVSIYQDREANARIHVVGEEAER